MVSIDGIQVHGSIYDSLQKHVHGPVLEQYLCAKFNWTKEQFDTIHWEAMEVYVKRVAPCSSN